MRAIDLIGAAIGWGASHPASACSPKALIEFGLAEKLLLFQSTLSWRIIKPPIDYTGSENLNYEQRQEQIKIFSQRLGHIVASSLSQDHMPIVLGGDHSCAIGTWSGVVKALNAKENFGLIWIDAHMDAHTIETTPSKNIHGMPLAVLLGHGDPQLTGIEYEGAKIKPEHVVVMGARSYEKGEADLLKKLKVKIFYMDDIKKQGFHQVFTQAIQHVKKGTMGYGISLDLDVFDPEVAPGVNTPAPGGIIEQDMLKEMKALQNDVLLRAFEIAEYNPKKDHNYKTARLIQNILTHYFD